MEQGHVEMEKISQDDRPDRKVYHITSAGRAALIEWLAGPPQVSEARSAVLIQVFFMGQLSNEEILKRFEGYTHIMKMVLDQYDQVPTNVEEIYTDVKSERERFFWMLTLENGICNMRANLEWAESVIERLKNGQVPEE
jgi:PadR family transcriptional regulator AphA